MREAFLWLLFLTSLTSMRWLFPGRWDRFALHRARIADQTFDCGHEDPRETIEVSRDNAERILARGFRQVLVSEGEGCYVLSTLLHLNALRREESSRLVTERKAKGSVLVTMILDINFSQLSEGKQSYAHKKFPKDARTRRYQLVTLAKATPDGQRDAMHLSPSQNR